MFSDSNNIFDGSTAAGAVTFTQSLDTGGYYATWKGAIHNLGAFSVRSGVLQIDAAGVTLDSGGAASKGRVMLAGGYINSSLNTAQGSALDNIDNQILGAGAIVNLKLTNEAGGLIDANVSGQTLSIDGSDLLVNKGLIEATNGGILVLSSQTVVFQTGERVTAGAGSSIDIASDTFEGGVFAGIGGGAFVFVDSNNVFDGSTAAGAVTLAQSLDTGGYYLTLKGAIHNLGALTTRAGSLDIDTAGVTLDSGGATTKGKILLAGGAINSSANATQGSDLDNVDNQILGYGAIYNLKLTNEAGGLIDASVSGQTLTIDGSSTITNKGVLEATSGATLGLADLFNDAGGKLVANNGAVVVSGAVTGAGTALIAAGGSIEFDGTSSENVNFQGRGSLTFNTNYTGAISGLALGDAINVVGVTGDAAHVDASDNLIVTEGGAVVETIKLSGANSNLVFAVKQLSGETQLIALPNPTTVAIFQAEKANYDLVAGGFTVADSLPNLTSHLGVLDGDSHITELFGTGGSATISGGAPIYAPAFVLGGTGTTLTVSENLTLHRLTLGAGAAVSISSGDTLTLAGATSLSGVITGGGALTFNGASTTINAGATLTQSSWTLSGAGAVTLNENLSYGGAFYQGGNPTISIASGDTLTLTGASTLYGAISGAGGLTLGGGATAIDAGAKFNQAKWTLSGADAASLNENLSYGGAFLQGASALSIAANDTLTLTGSSSLAGAISGSGSLALGGGSTSINAGGKLGQAKWAVSGAGTLVTLNESLNYGGAFAQIGNSTLSIASGDKLTLTGASTLAGAIAGAGDLTIGGGATSINIGAKLLQANWTLSGAGVVVTVSENLSYGGTFSQAANAALSVASGDTMTLTGSSTLSGVVSGSGGLTLGGGVTSINAGTKLTQAKWTLATAGAVSLNENMTYAGTFVQAGSPTLSIAAGDTLALKGSSTLFGKITGAGTLITNTGPVILESTGTVATSDWSSAAAALTIIGAHTFAGAFSASAETITYSGAERVSGAGTLSNVTLSGAGQFQLAAASTISHGLKLAKTAAVVDLATISQSAGDVVMGDASGGATTLIVSGAASIWDITDDSDIALGNAAASAILNAGVFEKSGTAGVSTIGAALTNAGKVEALSGTLELQRAVSGTGADIVGGASTLAFDAAVTGGQTIQFQGADGTLELKDLATFSGVLSNFDSNGATGATIDVSGPWSWLGFDQSTSMINFADGGAQHAIHLLGSYVAADFHHQVIGGVTQVTYG